ncbi:MAG: AmmeMemoRadiSam system radical SAM enzyme [Treponema sp.]|nr:AmmeMemoRadiSam system radical SAM enzyme [Treponema sp.]
MIQCRLCPRCCRLPDGGLGRCGVRGNRGGVGNLPYYAFITALAVDPIEKKPLYHFNPGSSILSLGFAGCNLHCPFCQNWHISQRTDVPGRYCAPADLIAAAQAEASPQIAYTYSEPLVHIEYLLDCMARAHESGLANVLVSNGCVQIEAAQAVLSLIDAVNVDLKCFSEDTYRRVLGGDLSTVLTFIKTAWKMGVHLELTTLVVPELNDSDGEIDRCIAFLAGLSKDIPWHLSAYHPAYQWNAPPTDASRLRSIARRARNTLSYVYTGNLQGEANDTSCPQCGQPLVQRHGYHVNTQGLIFKKEKNTTSVYCSHCGSPAPIVMKRNQL